MSNRMKKPGKVTSRVLFLVLAIISASSCVLSGDLCGKATCCSSSSSSSSPPSSSSSPSSSSGFLASQNNRSAISTTGNNYSSNINPKTGNTQESGFSSFADLIVVCAKTLNQSPLILNLLPVTMEGEEYLIFDGMDIPLQEDRNTRGDDGVPEDQKFYGPLTPSWQNLPGTENQVVPLGHAILPRPPGNLTQDHQVYPTADRPPQPIFFMHGLDLIPPMADQDIVRIDNDQNGRLQMILVHRLHQPVPHTPRCDQETQQLELLKAQLRGFDSMEQQRHSLCNLPTNNFHFGRSQALF